MQVTKLTIQSSQIPSSLTDFPVYVNLADMNAEFWSTVANGGGDIRVFKSDGTTELPREVVSCDTSTQTGELHFKYTGTLSSSVDTEVQIHADGVSSDYATTDTYGAENVWTTAKQVLHMEGDSVDSTSGSFDGTDTAITYSSANGDIGQGAGFNGTTSKIAYSSLGLGTSFTFTFWFNSNNVTSEQRFAYNDDTDNIFVINRILASKVDLFFYDGANKNVSGTTTLSNNTWYKFTGVYNSSGTCRVYLNATEEGTLAVGAKADLGIDFGRNIGTGRLATGQFMNGEVDEWRVYNSALSADWITTEYNNQNSPSTFYTAEAPGLSATITDTLSLTENITNLRDRNTTSTDTLSLSETVTGLKGIIVNITDTLGLTEVITKTMTFVSTITDTLGLTEVTKAKKLWTTTEKNDSTWTEVDKNSTTWTNIDK